MFQNLNTKDQNVRFWQTSYGHSFKVFDYLNSKADKNWPVYTFAKSHYYSTCMIFLALQIIWSSNWSNSCHKLLSFCAMKHHSPAFLSVSCHCVVILLKYVAGTGLKKQTEWFRNHWIRDYWTDLVGSSKNMTGGFVNNSRPIDSLFFSPPDNFATGVSIAFSSPRRFSILLICHNVKAL